MKNRRPSNGWVLVADPFGANCDPYAQVAAILWDQQILGGCVYNPVWHHRVAVVDGSETARAGETLMIPFWIEILELATVGLMLVALMPDLKKMACVPYKGRDMRNNKWGSK
jgi:hypothetical protein